MDGVCYFCFRIFSWLQAVSEPQRIEFAPYEEIYEQCYQLREIYPEEYFNKKGQPLIPEAEEFDKDGYARCDIGTLGGTSFYFFFLGVPMMS